MTCQPQQIHTLSPAKINLFLKITGKRADGYHAIASLMVCIDLWDAMTITVGGSDVAVACDHPAVPSDERNLAYKAAAAFFSALRVRPGSAASGAMPAGATITIHKKIPVAAGLGGGSSNAAAVFLGLNRLLGHPFSKAHLMRLGAKVGADVPFFIFGAPAFATGIGDRLQSCPRLPHLHLLLVCPEIQVSTAWVYKNLNFELTKKDKKIKNYPFRDMAADPVRHLVNDLETVTLTAFPEIQHIKKALTARGAEGVLMSGSGPAVFGVFADIDRARRARDELMPAHAWRMFAAGTLSDHFQNWGVVKR